MDYIWAQRPTETTVQIAQIDAVALGRLSWQNKELFFLCNDIEKKSLSRKDTASLFFPQGETGSFKWSKAGS